jgi:hypothetical protein
MRQRYINLLFIIASFLFGLGTAHYKPAGGTPAENERGTIIVAFLTGALSNDISQPHSVSADAAGRQRE